MEYHFTSLLIKPEQTVLDAVAVIEKEGSPQVALIVDSKNVLLGILTNGDLRRFLMHNGKMDAPVSECMNKNFHAVSKGTSRETLLKLFDVGYSAIPVIDQEGRLVEFVTPDFLPYEDHAKVISRARAPVRVSFSGGGTDLTYFFMNTSGAVLSASIARYAHATLIPVESPEIKIFSQDIDRYEYYPSLRTLIESENKGLLSAIVSVIRPTYGFELYVHSDFPVGSGLGGSSSVAVSVIAAFNELRVDKWSRYEISELAFHAERLCFGIRGGWQDQYASAFGGFNLIEFHDARNFVYPIRLEQHIKNELEESLILCDTGIEHHSGKIHEQQRSESEKVDHSKQLAPMVELCKQMQKHLIRGEINEFGYSLHDAWILKRKLSQAISNPLLDDIYAAAYDKGALGGKLLGAGGGGFFLFYVQPQNRIAVCTALKAKDCKLSGIRFEEEGVVSWRTKA